MPARLIATQRHTHLQPEYLLKPRKTRVGRHPDNDIVLMLESISRFHAELDAQDDMVLLRDLGSRNGTYLNGHRIRSAMPVRPGDRVQFGNVEFIFRSADLSEEADRSEGDTNVSVERARRTAMEVVSSKGVDSMVQELAGSGLAGEDGQPALVVELYRLSVWLRELAAGKLGQEALVDLLDRVFKVVPASRGAILKLDAETQELKPLAWQRHRGGNTSPKISIPQAITDAALESRKAILMGDASSDERFKHSESIAEMEISAAICVPMMIGGDILGVAYLDNQGSKSRGFTEVDLAFFGSVAQELAFAMRLSGASTATPSPSGSAPAVPIAPAAMAAAAVGKKSEDTGNLPTIDQMVSAIAAGLGRAFAGESDSADRMTAALDAGHLDEARQHWRLFRRSLRRLDAMIQEMSDFSAPPDLRLGTVCVNDVVHDALDAFSEEAKAKNIELRKRFAHDLEPRQLDEERFYKAVLAVLLNSMEALDGSGGAIEAKTYRGEDGSQRVEFQDNGPGVDAEVLRRAFEPFNPGPASRGSGMGLALAKRHIERLGGEITLKSIPGKGTKVVFALPPGKR
jgi:pSer/pThr/pTyr-binding forkhead associated (FHA) protein/anti-sigma regulatory factor (Ser/Thr protein kinase)